jgi:F-type H+-transporting ATPase subunit a
MEGINLLEQEHVVYPFSFLGVTHPLTAINADTIIATWITLGALTFVSLGCYVLLKYPKNLGVYLIKQALKTFIDLIEQSTGTFIERYYLFITSLFIFILGCNWISLIPGIEEPTKDLNTTLALGIISFLYSQKELIKSHGLSSFFKEYFLPFNIIFPLNFIAGIALLPLKLLGEFSGIISLSLRLFGNIFGGAIITSIFTKALGNSIIFNMIAIVPTIILTAFFIFFEGFLQAFVFTILSLTNLAMIAQEKDIL